VAAELGNQWGVGLDCRDLGYGGGVGCFRCCVALLRACEDYGSEEDAVIDLGVCDMDLAFVYDKQACKESIWDIWDM
jgi:hypothetical protein